MPLGALPGFSYAINRLLALVRRATRLIPFLDTQIWGLVFVLGAMMWGASADAGGERRLPPVEGWCEAGCVWRVEYAPAHAA